MEAELSLARLQIAALQRKNNELDADIRASGLRELKINDLDSDFKSKESKLREEVQRLRALNKSITEKINSLNNENCRYLGSILELTDGMNTMNANMMTMTNAFRTLESIVKEA